VSAMTVGGDTSEVVEDDDISVVSDDGLMRRSTQMGMCGQDLMCKCKVTIGS